MSDSFDIIINKLPEDSIKYNILYNLSKLISEQDKQDYKSLIIEKYYNEFPDLEYLYFKPLFSKEILDIHKRISYTKYDRVIRNGIKCKFCKGVNTFSKDEQKGGGDEYIPTRVTCYDCNKDYIS